MGSRRPPPVLPALAAALALCLGAPRDACAHTLGLSSGEYTVRGARVEATLVFARAEIARLVPLLDANADGHVSAVEVQGARPQLRAKVVERVLVTGRGGTACRGVLTDAAVTEQDGLLVSGRWDCGAATPELLELALLDDLAPAHRHVARLVREGATGDRVLSREDRVLELPAVPESDAGPPGRAAAPPTASPGVLAFIGLGFAHVLAGWDHLLFVLALVLVRARARALVRTVTAFTLAHSVTLALAALDVVAPSARVVEPLVALSIAVVALANLRGADGERRWRITAAFGLVHGFGFAGALRELALGADRIVPALVAFNVGVELAQLAALAVLLPILALLRRRTGFDPRGVRFVSIAIAAVAAALFVARLVPP